MALPIELRETPNGLMVTQQRSFSYYLKMVLLISVAIVLPIILLLVGFVTKYDLRCERSEMGATLACSSTTSKLLGDPSEEYYLSNVSGVTNVDGSTVYLTSNISGDTMPIKTNYGVGIQNLLNNPNELLFEKQSFNLKGTNAAGLLCCTTIWMLVMIGALINLMFTRTSQIEFDIQRREVRYQSPNRLKKTTTFPLDDVLYASYHTYPTWVSLIFRSGQQIVICRHSLAVNANRPNIPPWAIEVNNTINAWLQSHNIGFHE